VCYAKKQHSHMIKRALRVVLFSLIICANQACDLTHLENRISKVEKLSDKQYLIHVWLQDSEVIVEKVKKRAFRVCNGQFTLGQGLAPHVKVDVLGSAPAQFEVFCDSE